MTVQRTIMRAAALALLLALPAPQARAGYSAEDAAYKSVHLTSLRLYGPKLEGDQRAVWTRMIGLAAEHEDYEIVAQMLSLAKDAGPATKTQYAYDLFTLYAQAPEFFVAAVERFYGSCEPLLALWIDRTGGINSELLRVYVPAGNDSPLLAEFIAEAVAWEQALAAN